MFFELIDNLQCKIPVSRIDKVDGKISYEIKYTSKPNNNNEPK